MVSWGPSMSVMAAMIICSVSIFALLSASRPEARERPASAACPPRQSPDGRVVPHRAAQIAKSRRPNRRTSSDPGLRHRHLPRPRQGNRDCPPRQPGTPPPPPGRSSLAGGSGQLLIGDDSGLRVGRRSPGTRPAGLGRLAGVPGVGVGHRDHPVLGDLAGDPPPPVRPSEPSAGSTSCPATRASSATADAVFLLQLGVLQCRHHRVRVVHQRRHQRVLRGRIVPVDRRVPACS